MALLKPHLDQQQLAATPSNHGNTPTYDSYSEAGPPRYSPELDNPVHSNYINLGILESLKRIRIMWRTLSNPIKAFKCGKQTALANTSVLTF